MKRKLLKALLKNSLFFLKQQNSLKKREITVGKGNLGMKFLVLSDLHLNMHMKESIDNLRSLENTEYDTGVILGDVFEWTYKKNHKQAIELLSGFIKDSGKKWIAVMGNHDNENTRNILLECGVTILDNKWMTLNAISIYGFSDKAPEYKIPSEKNDAVLYLSHRPDNLLKVKEEHKNIKHAFSIAGHTHGGQITVGKFTPIKNTRKKEMVYGHWTLGCLKGYTTSGFGYSGVPIRIGTQQEYVIIHY